MTIFRAFFKKLQLLGPSLNEGLFLTRLLVHKNHPVLRGSASVITSCKPIPIASAEERGVIM